MKNKNKINSIKIIEEIKYDNSLDYDSFSLDDSKIIRENMNINYICKKEKNIISIIYKMMNKIKIRIFGHRFVSDNINNCVLLINEKYYKLNECYEKNYEDNSVNNIFLEIKLIEIYIALILP